MEFSKDVQKVGRSILLWASGAGEVCGTDSVHLLRVGEEGKVAKKATIYFRGWTSKTLHGDPESFSHTLVEERGDITKSLSWQLGFYLAALGFRINGQTDEAVGTNLLEVVLES